MKNNPYFTRDRRMGQNPRGPMEYQPSSWQGWLILLAHVFLALVLIYFSVVYINHFTIRILVLFVGGAVIFASYNLIASFHAHDQVRGKKKGSEDHVDRFKKG